MKILTIHIVIYFIDIEDCVSAEESFLRNQRAPHKNAIGKSMFQYRKESERRLAS